MSSGPPGRPSRRTAVAVAAVVAAAAAAHGRSLAGGWVFDDARFIVNNPHVVAPTSWTSFLTNMRTTDPLSPTGIVRPLRTAEFALDAQIAGLSPSAFHVHSLLWFAAAAVTLFFLLRRLVGCDRAALAGAVLWTVHPMQTEAVAWISSRGDVACAALVFGAALAALRPGRAWTAGSVALALLAAGYKETGVVAPLLVAILRCVAPTDGRRTGLAANALRAWPWFVAAAVYLAYRAAVQVGDTAHVGTYVLGGGAQGTFSTMFRGFGAYAAFAVLPVRPAVDWYLDASATLADATSLAWLAAHAAILVAGFRGLSSESAGRRAASAGALVFYSALLPVANWPWYLGIPTAERFLHIPLAGAALAAAAAFRGAERRGFRVVPIAAVAAAAMVCTSVVRTADWRDDTTLWPATARVVASPRAEGYLAAELRREGFAQLAAKDPAAYGTLEAGLAHAHRCLSLWARIEGTRRSKSHVVAEPQVNAANLCYLVGRPGEALHHADEAIRIGETLFPQAHYNRALALIDLGRGAAAAAAILRATQTGMSPDGEVRGMLLRAAALCEEDGELGAARSAIAAAAGLMGPGDGRATAALREFDRRAETVRDRIRADAASGAGRRATLALALHSAALGAVAEADALAEEADPTGEFRRSADWARARWAARATTDGWSRAEEVLRGSRDPESMFLRARSLEELGRSPEARTAFAEFLDRAAAGASPDDPRVRRARAAAERLTRPCPAEDDASP